MLARVLAFLLLGAFASVFGACSTEECDTAAVDCLDKCGLNIAPTCADGEPVCGERTGPCPGGKKGKGEACRAGECFGAIVCVPPLDACGPFAEQDGVCGAGSHDCSVSGPAACGCDGKVYPTACAAWEAGVNLASGCAPAVKPAGTFRCGPYYCDPKKTYCWSGPAPVSGTGYACVQPAGACTESAIVCSCLNLADTDTCTTVEDEGVSGIRVDSKE